jgi:hypothetical protein
VISGASSERSWPTPSRISTVVSRKSRASSAAGVARDERIEAAEEQERRPLDASQHRARVVTRRSEEQPPQVAARRRRLAHEALDRSALASARPSLR